MNGSSSSPSRSSMSTAAVAGGSTSNVALSAEDFPFPPDPICVHDRKAEAMLALKADLKAALDKEVKSMDEESWKFEGPRSRINLLSKPGFVLFIPCVIAIVEFRILSICCLGFVTRCLPSSPHKPKRRWISSQTNGDN